jgi:hypothetical protein
MAGRCMNQYILSQYSNSMLWYYRCLFVKVQQEVSQLKKILTVSPINLYNSRPEASYRGLEHQRSLPRQEAAICLPCTQSRQALGSTESPALTASCEIAETMR